MAALPAAAHVGKRTRTILVNNTFEFGGDFVDGLVPGNPLKFIPDFFQRIFQPVGIVLMIGDMQTLAADIAFAFYICLVALHFNDAVRFHLDFQAAILCAEDTAGFMNLSHNCSFSPAFCPGVQCASSTTRGILTQGLNDAVQITLLFFG